MLDFLPNLKDYATVSTAAEMLGVSIATIRRWDEQGTLHSERLDGKNRYFLKSDLKEFAENRPLSISEASHILSVSVSTLRRLEKKGLIVPTLNTNGERIYSQKMIEEYLSGKKKTNKSSAVEPIVFVQAPVLASVPVSLEQEIAEEVLSAPSVLEENLDQALIQPAKTDSQEKVEVEAEVEKKEEVKSEPASSFKVVARNDHILNRIGGFKTLEYLKDPRASSTQSNQQAQEEFESVNNEPEAVSHERRAVNYKSGAFVLASLFLITAGVFVFTMINGSSSSNKNAAVLSRASSKSRVLAAATSPRQLTVNIQSLFNESIKVNNKDLDIGTGNLTASNIVYGITAGDGISITPGQNPVISATATGVSSFGNATGAITLGSGLSVTNNTLTANIPSTTNSFATIVAGGTNISAGGGSDTLTFAAGTGITLSASGKDITITSTAVASDWGLSGTSLYPNSTSYNVGIGNTAPSAKLDVTGNMAVSGVTTLNGVAYTWPVSTSNNFILSTNGSGALSWMDPGTLPSSNFFSLANGTVYPQNPNLDFLIGGTSTGAAKFGFLGVSSGTPTIQINGTDVLTVNTLGSGVTNSSLTSTGALSSGSIGGAFGSIVTTNTITGSTINGTTGINTGGGSQRIDNSGDVKNIADIFSTYLNASGSNVNLAAGTALQINSGTVIDSSRNLSNIGTTQFNNVTYTWPGVDAAAPNYVIVSNSAGGLSWVNPGSLPSVNYFNIASGTISPRNVSLDFLIGDTSTVSAKFGLVNVLAGTPAIQIGGNTVLTGNTLGGNVVNSSLTSVGALSGGSIASGFGTIETANTITGTTLDGTLGVNTGAVSGTPRIDNSGDLLNIGTTQFNTAIYTWPVSDGLTGYAMTTNGGGGLSWVSAGGFGTNYFSIANGALYPTNPTLDFLIGGDTSASAKFGFLNVDSGAPVIQIGGNTVLTSDTLGSNVINSSLTSVGALSVGSIASGFGNITTVNTITGTTLNGTTGVNTGAGAGTQRIDSSGNLKNIGTTQFNSAIYTWPASDGGAGYVLTTNGTGSLVWESAGGMGTNYFGIADGALYPINPTLDFLIGGNSSASAKFGMINVGSGAPALQINGNTVLTIDTLGAGVLNSSIASVSALTTGSIASGFGIIDILGNITGTTLNGTTGVNTGGTQRIDSSGNLTNIGTTQFNTVTYTWPATDVGLSGYALTTNGSGGLSWAATGGFGTNYFGMNAGAIYPVNTALDFLIGGTSTGAAKFGFINVSSGVPSIQISGTTVLTGDTLGGLVINSSLTSTGALSSGSLTGVFGTISTANTITGTTLNGTTGINTGAVAGTQRIDLNGNLTNIGTTQFGPLTYTWPGSVTNSYVLQTDGAGGLSWVSPASSGFGTNYFTLNVGTLSPTNTTTDFLLGNSATTSARFAVTNVLTGTPVASLSAGIAGGAYLTAAGVLQTTAMQKLVLGGNTTGDIQFLPGNTSSLYLASNGYAGIGTTTPGVALDIVGSLRTNNNFYVNGGISNITSMNDVINVNKNLGANVTDSWSTGTAGGTPRSYHTSILYNGKIYTWGGWNGSSGFFNTMDIYDIASNSWSTGAAGGVARQEHTSVLYNGKIYSWGGSDGSGNLNTVDIYDITNNSWSTGAAGGTVRYGHTSVLYNGKMYSWGGSNSGGVLNTVDIYDITNNTWSTGAAGGRTNDWHTSILYNGKMYIVGGYSGGDSVDIYDIAGNSWSMGTTGGAARQYNTSVLYNGKIYSYGGMVGSGDNTVDIYDIASGVWSTGIAGGSTYWGKTSVLYNGKMYSWGGFDSYIDHNTMDIYDIGFKQNILAIQENGVDTLDFQTGSQMFLASGRLGIMGGNLGIGTTTPGTTLDVSGTVRTNNNLYVNGGTTNMTGLNDVLNVNKNLGANVTGSWSTGAAGGIVRERHTSILYNGKVYLWGGCTDGYCIGAGGASIVDIYDIASNSWSTGASGGTVRENHTSILYNGKIYSWGGINTSGATAINTLDIYDIASNSWSTGASGGTPRQNSTSILYNGKIYSWGGCTTNCVSTLNTVDIYDIAGNSWTTGAAGGTPRWTHTSVLYNGKIYSWAGANSGGSMINTVDIYDIAGNSWSTGAAGGTARYAHTSILYNGKIYSWGGYNAPLNTVNIYDIASNSWSTGAAGGTARMFATSAIYNGKMYIFAGAGTSESPRYNIVDIYDIGFKQNILSLQENGVDTLNFQTGSQMFLASGRMGIMGGNVGIGTSTPGTTLDVNGTIRTNNNLYVNGGTTNMTGLNDVLNVNKNLGANVTGSWSTGKAGGTARNSHTSTLYNGKVYSWGGYGGGSLNTVDIYDIAGNSWSTGASGGTARLNFSSVLYNGSIYIWGGNNNGGTRYNTMDIYNINANSWSTGATGGTARDMHTSILYNGKIYSWGGNPGPLNTVDIYDIANNSWSTGAAGGTARSSHTSVLYNGKIYSWGGTNGGKLNTVDIYDIAGNAWTTGTAGGTARSSHTSVLYNGKIYSWGGYGSDYLNTVDIYDIASGIWSTGTTGGNGGAGASSILYNGKIYSLGGANGGGWINTVAIYDIGFKQNILSLQENGTDVFNFQTGSQLFLANGRMNIAGGSLGIGTASPSALLDVNGTASISGVLKLYAAPVIQSTAMQNLTLGGDTTGDIILSPRNSSGTTRINGATTLNTVAYTWPGADGGSGYALTTNSAGTLSWSPAGGFGTNYFAVANGALYSTNPSEDFLIGNASSVSAAFGFINTSSGAPTIQISGADVLTANTLGGGILTSSLTSTGALTGGSIASGFGTISTSNTITGTTLNGTTGINTGGTQRIDVNGNLVNIGDISSTYLTATTNIVNLPSGTALQINSTPVLDSSRNLVNIGTTQFNTVTYTWPGSLTAGYALTTSGTGTLSWTNPLNMGTNYFSVDAAGTLYPTNTTLDFLIGASSSSSADFAVLNVANGSPTASLSAQAAGGMYLTAGGVLQTTAKQTLTLGGSTTGDIQFLPGNNSTGLYLASSGFVGIGTTAPGVALDVSGAVRASSNFYSNGGTANVTSGNDVLNVNRSMSANVTGSWTTGAAGGRARYEHTSTVYNGKIYFWGGYDGSLYLNTMDIYDIASNSWSTGATGGRLRGQHTSVLYNGKIYSWGGTWSGNGGAMNTMDIYDIVNNSWSIGTAGGTVRNRQTATLYNGKIYFLGGCTAGGCNYLNSVDIYDIAGNSWSTGASGGNSVASFTSVLYNGKIYSWGGYSGPQNTVDVYDIANNSWSRGISQGGTARVYHSSIIYNGKMYIWGGFYTGSSLNTIDIYNITSNSWSTGITGGTARNEASSVVYNGKMYTWGGSPNFGAAINTMDIYDIGFKQNILAIQENGQDTLNFQTGSQMFLASGRLGIMGGNVGIGTATPSATLDVNGSIRANGNIYSNSGTANITGSNDVINVNKNLGATVTGTWSTGASGGTARYGQTSILYNGKIYSWGGYNGSTLFNTVDIYDIAGNSWSTGAAGGTARQYPTSILYNGKIYFWGGTTGSYLNTVDIYDIAGNSWSTGAAGGTARAYHTSVLYNGKIYSWGGCPSGCGSNLNTVDIYDIAGNSWSTGAAGGTARFIHTSVLYNGKIYSWGGSTGSIVNTMDIYDIAGNVWSTGTTGGTARYQHTSVLYNGKIYSWGGLPGPLNTMDIYDIGFKQNILSLQENGVDTLDFQSGSQLFLANGRMNIAGGNVGIGTSTPGTTLDIVGTMRTSGNVTVAGGTTNITSLNDVANVNKNLGAYWSTGTAGGTVRMDHVSAVYNGKMYSWGGMDSSNATINTLDIYDTVSGTWSTGTAGGTARRFATATAYNGNIYIWGGGSTPTNTMDIYNIAGNSWSTGATGGTARMSHTSVLYNGKIYSWAGSTDGGPSGATNTVDIYDIGGNSWSTGTTGGTPRYQQVSVVYNGKMYSWGGLNSSSVTQNTMDIYDINGGTWTTGATGGTARRYATSALYNGKMYIWGGNVGAINTMDIYDISSDSWSIGQAGGTARAEHTSVLYNGKIYSWAGSNSSSRYNTVDIYNINQTILTLQENGVDTLNFQAGSQMYLASGTLGIMGGNVGIGVATPSATLDVNGSIRASGNFYVNGGTSNITSGNDVINVNKNLGANVTDSWSTGTAGGTARYYHTSVIYNGKIYSWGGCLGNCTRLATIDIYDIASNSWSTGTAGGTARAGHTSVLYNGKIYSWGGVDNGNNKLNTIDRYDIAADSWSTRAAGGTARYYHTSVLYNGKMYIWGGADSGGAKLNTLDIYDIANNSWSTGTAGGTARVNHTSVLYNGKIYSWGGIGGSYLNTVDIYDITSNSWSTGTAGGTARYSQTSVLYNGKMYSWGGYGGGYLNTVDIYDIANNSWSTGTAGGTARYEHASVLYNGKIYSWGGTISGVTGLSTIDIYDIGFKQNILSLQENGVDTLNFQTGSQMFLASGRLGIMGGNVGIGSSSAAFKLDISTSTASDRGINVLNTAATGTNYGIYSSVTGAATTNVGGYFYAVGAATDYGLQVAAMTGATNTGLDIGALSGGTANTGVNVGNISAGTGTSFSGGAISSTGTTNYGLTLGTMTGGTASNYQINTGILTSATTTTNAQLNLGGIVTTGGTTNYGINVGALSGTGATNYGINVTASSATGTTNYGINIGNITGAASGNNYGLYIGTVSGANSNTAANNFALYSSSSAYSYFGGNVGIGTTSPGALLSVGSGSATNFGVNSSGDVTSGITTLNGSSTANGTGAVSTTLILNSATNFDIGNYVQVSSTDCVTGVNVCYAKITNIVSNTLTISPALTWANSSAVVEVHVPEVGGTDTAATLANRYGRGYFIDGIVTGNGSSYFTDNSIKFSGGAKIQNYGGLLTLQAGGSATGSTGTSSIYFNDSTGATRARIETGIVAGGPTVTKTFSSTGAYEDWTVPPGVNSINVVVKGGDGQSGSGISGTSGGRTTATYAVTPGQSIRAYVGRSGANGGWGSVSGSGSGTGVGVGGGQSKFTITGVDKAIAGGGGGGGAAGGVGQGPFDGYDNFTGYSTYFSSGAANGGNASGQTHGSASSHYNVYQQGDVPADGTDGSGTTPGTGGRGAVAIAEDVGVGVVVYGGRGGNGGSAGLAGGGGGGGSAGSDGLAGGGGGGAATDGEQWWGRGGRGGDGTAGTAGTTGTNSASGGTGASYGSNGAGDGTIVFTYASYGTLYTGATNTSSADVAELYHTNDAAIEAGDLVVWKNNGLDKTTNSYDSNIMGVVSTAPGVTLGSQDGADNTDKRPVALSGRVPLKVSSENGVIHSGDMLTSSSVPGVAMRATKFGTVVGQAMEDYLDANPQDILKIEVFISLGNNLAQTIGALPLGSPIYMPDGTINQDYQGQILTADQTDKMITEKLAQPQNSIVLGSSNSAQVTVKSSSNSASWTMTLPTDVGINGSILTTDGNGATSWVSIDSLTTPLRNEVFTQINTIFETLAKIQDQDIPNINNQLSVFTVAADGVEFAKSAVLGASTTFNNSVQIMQGIVLGGRIKHTDLDTAGFAVIKGGTMDVKVVFNRPYEAPPVISITSQDSSSSSSAYVKDVSQDGFTVSVPATTSADLKFSWNAILVATPRTIQSVSSE